eukprot:4644442-Prymnesium_polylepis.1
MSCWCSRGRGRIRGRHRTQSSGVRGVQGSAVQGSSTWAGLPRKGSTCGRGAAALTSGARRMRPR